MKSEGDGRSDCLRSFRVPAVGVSCCFVTSTMIPTPLPTYCSPRYIRKPGQSMVRPASRTQLVVALPMVP